MADKTPDGGNVPITFIDNPHAPEVFADQVCGIFNYHGVIRLTFETARVNHVTSPGPVNRVVVARLNMPLSAAKDLQQFLNKYFADQNNPPTVQMEAPKTLQ